MAWQRAVSRSHNTGGRGMKWRWRIMGWTMNLFDGLTLLAFAGLLVAWALTCVL